MKREHPSNTIHEATNYFDALTRREAALRYEQPYLDEYDREHGTETDRSTYTEAMAHAKQARAIWSREYTDLHAAISRLNLEAKQRAAAAMRAAGIPDDYAAALEDDDFGRLAI